MVYQICSLMRGGIAERGGVRVGHKIIEMNGESVVAASHHHIVDVLQTTIGEVCVCTICKIARTINQKWIINPCTDINRLVAT